MDSVRFVHAMDDYSVGKFTVRFLKLARWPKFWPGTLLLADRCNTQRPGPTDNRIYDGYIVLKDYPALFYRVMLNWCPATGVTFNVISGAISVYQDFFPRVSLKNWVIGVKRFDSAVKGIIDRGNNRIEIKYQEGGKEP